MTLIAPPSHRMGQAASDIEPRPEPERVEHAHIGHQLVRLALARRQLAETDQILAAENAADGRHHIRNRRAA